MAHERSCPVNLDSRCQDRIAAITQFANRDAVYTGTESDGVPPEDVPIAALVGEIECAPNEISVSSDAIREILDTGLFSSRGPNRLGWAHQTYAEFLAALYCKRHGMPVEQLRSLLFHPANEGQSLVPQLRELPGMLRRQGQYVNERGGSLARRRYQKGQLLLIGGIWYGRWRKDRIENGKIKRARPQEALGTLNDYPTKRLAQRALDDHLRTINDVSYRPRPTATFVQFSSRWEEKTLNQFAASTGVNYRSHIRKHLVPFFGPYAMKEIGPELVQEFISDLKVSPKTARNIAITLQSMWSSARAWGYVAHDVMEGVRFASPKRARRFFFSAEEVQRIIVAAKEPHRTFYGLAAETGLRAGELCGLTVQDLDFEKGLLQVRQNVWRGKVKDTKTIASARVVELSPQACQHLQQFLKTWRPNVTGLL